MLHLRSWQRSEFELFEHTNSWSPWTTTCYWSRQAWRSCGWSANTMSYSLRLSWGLPIDAVVLDIRHNFLTWPICPHWKHTWRALQAPEWNWRQRGHLSDMARPLKMILGGDVPSLDGCKERNVWVSWSILHQTLMSYPKIQNFYYFSRIAQTWIQNPSSSETFLKPLFH